MKTVTQHYLMRALMVFGLCVGLATSARSQTTVTLNPTADTDTQSDNATGTSPNLNASQYNYIFLKFSLSGISGTVTSARVRIDRSRHA
jgi:hypothetical protein